MFNHQFFVSLKRAMRLETVKHFVQVHQDRIKTVALPLLVIAAVLFFWIYGNVQDGESIRVEDAAADAQQTEDVQDDGTAEADAAEQTPQGRYLCRYLRGGCTSRCVSDCERHQTL